MTAVTSAARISAEDFQALRPSLFGIAYRMTGSAADAEDILQDAWLRLERDQATPASPRAYLATIVTRLAIDHLRALKARREEYPGEWLPEPIVRMPASPAAQPEAVAGARETISYAMLVLLERLSAIERAVFVLHEGFDFKHAEIAEMLAIPEATSRQHLKRARDRVGRSESRFQHSPAKLQELTSRFVAAVSLGDVAGLAALLRQDCVAISDGGGRAAAAINPIRGADRVSRFFAGLRQRFYEKAILRPVEVDGDPAYLLILGHRLEGCFVPVFGEDGLIEHLYVMRNPDKLRSIEDAALEGVRR